MSEYGELIESTMAMNEHHASVYQYLPYQNADYYGLMIVCPECDSEWGWSDDIRGNGIYEKLKEMAEIHNDTTTPNSHPGADGGNLEGSVRAD